MQLIVLTGDLVSSTDLSKDELDSIMSELDRLARHFSQNCLRDEGDRYSSFARRGGDGWQIACSSDENPLKVALGVQATVRATRNEAATRIAVASGDGTVDTNLNAAHGPVFTASGQLLDRIDARLMAHADGGALDAAFCLADHVARGWTQSQARALALKLLPGSPANRVIGDRLGISRQAVDQALAGAGYAALKNAIEILDKGVQPRD